METNHEQIVTGVSIMAGSRPFLHVVAGMAEREEIPCTLTAKIHPSIGSENQGMMDALTASKRVATILAHRGFVVLEAHIGWRNSRIAIEAAPKCANLGGAEIMRVVTAEFDERTMSVSIHGVQVEWIMRRPL
ncbi:hypothetical protein [Nitrosovibrio sp. Nv6]|uniref:hypothetical protein n=1 Tax=Nitrosovibrio sp. Nv6 TaxID=1855340 RepID=UPI0008D0030A|nr:hypothetical protein [Nitrosovibrio sp. Nv6]SEO65310.1 hypothetical protein SAMN05216316_0716 [Nitrosovibrio sp. Nv6]